MTDKNKAVIIGSLGAVCAITGIIIQVLITIRLIKMVREKIHFPHCFLGLTDKKERNHE